MKIKCSIIFIFFSIAFGKAFTVKSVSNGDWSNTSIWSSGAIPITPDSIIISHYVTFGADLTINAPTVLYIDNTATLCGDYKLSISCNAWWINYGAVFLHDFYVKGGAKNYCTLTSKNSVTITGPCTPAQFGFWNAPPKGNVNVWPAVACQTQGTQWENGGTTGGGCTVGIEEYVNDKLILIYPNPVQDKLSIDLLKDEQGNVFVNDISGRNVIKATLGKKNEIDISKLCRGIYFIEIQSENYSVTKKIIKQ